MTGRFFGSGKPGKMVFPGGRSASSSYWEKESPSVTPPPEKQVWWRLILRALLWPFDRELLSRLAWLAWRLPALDTPRYPQFPFEIKIAIHAQSWESVMSVVECVSEAMRSEGPHFANISGSGGTPQFGYDVSVKRREVSADQLKTELRAWDHYVMADCGIDAKESE
jgi:hypothetical protein